MSINCLPPSSPFPSLPSESYPAAGLSRPPPLSGGTTDNVNHAVCDWQLSKMAVAAHRGMENPFSGSTRVGPRAHLSAENRSTDYQSQLTPSQPREGLVGRGKAQSNTNKHEEQQMALCQSSALSFLFFLNLTTPLSAYHLHLLTLILTIQYKVSFLISFFLGGTICPQVV